MNSLLSKFDLKTAIVLLYTPIALTVFRYYGSALYYTDHFNSGDSINAQFYYFLSSLIILGLIPLLVSAIGFHMNLSALGLGLGDKRATIIFTLIGIPIMILLAYFSSLNPAFRAEYPLAKTLLQNQSDISPYLMIYGAYYLGWEIFFRGFMLLGLRDSLGNVNSILIQTIPSCLMHIGKPDTEIFASIAAGLIFGWVVIKCRSIWPVFFSHWALGGFLDIFIIYG